jgi:acyl-CoA reductase-like NAD-dependent aldehyde dehydrogenase
MREEIFGPVLLVLPVDSVADAVAFVNGRDEKPLVSYVRPLALCATVCCTHACLS